MKKKGYVSYPRRKREMRSKPFVDVIVYVCACGLRYLPSFLLKPVKTSKISCLSFRIAAALSAV